MLVFEAMGSLRERERDGILGEIQEPENPCQRKMITSCGFMLLCIATATNNLYVA